MRRFFTYILITAVLSIIVIPNLTYAEETWTAAIGNSIVTGLTTAAGSIVAPVLSAIFFLIQKIMALWMGLGGLLLNFVIKHTILEMSGNIGKLAGINIAWKVLRDLMNIGFIFILVFEGIKIIIGSNDSNKGIKIVSGIVLASLLINFSLFFTKVIIDGSNIITIGVYESIIKNTSGPENTTNPLETTNAGLSNSFQQSLGLQGLFSTKSINLGNSNDDYGYLVANLMASVLFFITGFIFLAVSVMFVIRYIVLIMLLALSPIAFMGLALPGIKNQSNEWWATLWGQIIFAPLYMIMTWVILTLINSGGFLGDDLDNTQWTAVLNTQTGADMSGSISLFFNFALVIGLTIASLIVSKKYATQGSAYVGKMTNTATAYAGNTLLGGAGRIGRGTIGRAGNAIANNDSLKETAVKGGLRGYIAKSTLQVGDRGAKSSFDVRSSTAFSTLVKPTTVDFGKGADSKKVNFQKDLETKASVQETFAKTLKPSDADMAKIKDQTGHTDLENTEKSAKLNQENSIKVAEELLKKEKDLKDELAKANSADSNVTQDEIKIIEDKIKAIQDRRRIEADRQDNLKKSVEDASKKVKSSQEELDKIYKNRVEDYAKSFENESALMRYTKNAFKIPLTTPTSKGDNKEIAKKIRGVIKEKKKPTAKEIKELFGVDIEEDKTETKPEEPKSDDAKTDTPKGDSPKT